MFSIVGFGQSQTKLLNDTIDIKIPLDKQISPSKVREILKSINRKTQIVSSEPVVNPNPNFISKGDGMTYPHGNQGGINTNPTFRVWKHRNATSYDFVVSKSPTLLNPTNYVSSSTNFTVTGLDTNTVYYWKFRGKNANYTGVWSDVKKFDTYAMPLGCANCNSLFDLVEYNPLVTKWSWYMDMMDNVVYSTYFRISDKQIFTKHFRGDVTSFPFTVQTGVAQTLGTFETACMVTYAWGKDPAYLDIAPYLVLTNGVLTLNMPNTTFPIAKIEFYANIFYTKQ
jgi:hypothetical protein